MHNFDRHVMVNIYWRIKGVTTKTRIGILGIGAVSNQYRYMVKVQK